MSDPQVLIVGAGPTGLALAIELSRFNLPYRLIDRSPHQAEWSQALVVQARTLEQFERYGIATTAVERGRKVRGATLFSERKPVLHFDLSGIHSRYPFALFLPQNETERLLIEHLTQIGGRIEREVELVSFNDQGNRIEATLRHADEQTEVISVPWLVGCDGAHSIVRRQTGVSFEGNTVDTVFFLGDLHLSGPDLPGDELRIYLHRGNLVFFGRLTETIHRVIVSLHEQQQADAQSERDLTVDDFQRAIDACVGPEMRVSDPTWITRFRINQRMAHQYRVGRAFLAGDASHIHSPVAGQGMNTGIQDAANLGWKLAAVSQGAPEALLDSYNEEREAVGKTLLATTSRGLAAAITPNPTLETIRDYVLSWLGGLSFVQERAREFVSEMAVQYRHSSIVHDCGSASASSLRAGDRAPDATYRDANGQERRLYEHLSAPGHTLLLLHVGEPQASALAELRQQTEIVALHPYPDEELEKVYGGKGEPLLYAIRPDGYIGLRCRPDDTAALTDYAARVGLATAPMP